MSRFHLLCALLVAIAIAASGQVNAAAKTSAANTWETPRTADGQPDLQGVWTNATNIPMERPKELGAREFYAEEEMASFADKGFRGDRNPLPEAHYDMSQFGIDPTQARFAPNRRTSLIIGPEGRIPPLTPAGQKRNAELAAKSKGHEFDGPENRPLAERCIMWAQEGPPMLAATYNNNLEIVQSPGVVAIFTELIHDTRLILIDRRPHIASGIQQWRGDSRGHWEGETLVVDTTNFTSKTAFRGASENLHLVERLTRTSAETIVYEFTVDDPSTWTKPWTAQLIMGPAQGQIYEYACHEGNYGLANSLSGARAEEADKGSK